MSEAADHHEAEVHNARPHPAVTAEAAAGRLARVTCFIRVQPSALPSILLPKHAWWELPYHASPYPVHPSGNALVTRTFPSNANDFSSIVLTHFASHAATYLLLRGLLLKQLR